MCAIGPSLLVTAVATQDIGPHATNVGLVFDPLVSVTSACGQQCPCLLCANASRDTVR